MDRLTEEAWRNLDPWECCGQDRYCNHNSRDQGGCHNGCIVPKLYRKLARLEDAESQERLVILPCKVGTTVYEPVPRCKADYRYCPYQGGYGTDRCKGSERCNAYVRTRAFSMSDSAHIGRTVFLSREEAEEVVRRMNNES